MSEYNRGQSDTGLLPDVVPGPGLLPGAVWLGLQGALGNVRALLYLTNKAYFPFDLPDWPLVPETGFQSVSG